MRFSLKETRLGLRNSTTRIPFRYGSACLTRCPQAVLEATIEVDGRLHHGYSGDCLTQSWFDKTPGKSFAQQIDDMLAAIALGEELFGEETAQSTTFFPAWLAAYRRMHEAAPSRGWNELLASFGLSMVERAIIDALRQWGVAGHRVMGKTGVWAGGEPGEKPGKGQNPRGRKIAAIGVRVSGGVAMHGFALNVSTDLSYSPHIVPCGMPRLDMTSIRGEMADASDAGAAPTVRHAGEVVAGILARHLQRELVWTSPAAVRPAATASA